MLVPVLIIHRFMRDFSRACLLLQLLSSLCSSHKRKPALMETYGSEYLALNIYSCNFLDCSASPKILNLHLVRLVSCKGWRSCRALAFHQCGPGSIPGLGVISGLSLLVLYSAPRGFSPGTPVFPSPQKLTFDLI